jgi:hypothetical protein
MRRSKSPSLEPYNMRELAKERVVWTQAEGKLLAGCHEQREGIEDGLKGLSNQLQSINSAQR